MNGKKERIVNFLESRNELLFPREIARELGLNHSTTKIYLRDLAKDGFIFRDEAHRYCSKVTYGVIKPLLIHNLRFKVEAPWLRDIGKIEDDDERVAGVHFWVQYGRERGLVTGGIAYDRGLDQAHILLLIRQFYGLVERKTNHRVDSFLVTTLEWNRDYVGKRLDNRDGLRCFTYDEFEDYLTRVYQKDDLTVRVETKTSKPMTLNELLETQRLGSLAGSMSIELANRIIEKMETVIDVNKFFNGRINGIETKVDALHSDLGKTIEVLNKVSEGLQNIPKLVDPLTRLANLAEEGAEESKKKPRPVWLV